VTKTIFKGTEVLRETDSSLFQLFNIPSTGNLVKGTVSQKSVSKSILGEALDLKYELLNCLKIFRSTRLTTFVRSKNALTPCPDRG
jgi:hypothetical protein